MTYTIGEVAVTVTAGSTDPKPGSIWAVLAARLGREPTPREAADEVRRILGGAA